MGMKTIWSTRTVSMAITFADVSVHPIKFILLYSFSMSSKLTSRFSDKSHCRIREKRMNDCKRCNFFSKSLFNCMLLHQISEDGILSQEFYTRFQIACYCKFCLFVVFSKSIACTIAFSRKKNGKSNRKGIQFFPVDKALLLLVGWEDI